MCSRIFGLWLAVVCLSASALGQRGFMSDHVFNRNGQPAVNASVRICAKDATGTPCTPTVTLYKTQTQTPDDEKSNPTATDNSGRYWFYLAPGCYKAQVTYLGITRTMDEYCVAAITATGEGGGGLWGNISGTMSNQADLQAALDAKLDVSSYTAPVQPDWNAVSGLGQILNKPTIPAAQIQSDWTQASTGALDFIKNKPNLGALALKNSVDYSTSEVTNKPTLGTAAALNVPASGNAAAGEVVKGSDTRLSDSRTPSAHVLNSASHTVSGLTTGNYLRANSATTFGFSAILDADLPSTIARDSELPTNLNQLATRNYSDLQSIPATFAPSAHVLNSATHTASGLTAGHVLRATGATAFAFGAIQDSDIPSTIARDSELPSVPITAIQNNGVGVTPSTGAINLVPGGNVTLTTSGNGITIAASGGSGGYASVTENPSDVTSTKKIIAPSFQSSGTGPALLEGPNNQTCGTSGAGRIQFCLDQTNGAVVGSNGGANTKLVLDSDSRLTDSRTPTAHTLISASHTASGLTTGNVVRATGATTFAFGAIQDTDIPATIARDSEIPTNLNQLATRTYSDLQSIPSSFTPAAHTLVSASHTATGLTTGHVLRATGATAFSFGAIQAGDLPAGYLDAVGDISNSLCTANQVLKKNAGNTAWACAADDTTAGGVAWGAITGTLTDQADLNTALGAKANTASLATVATSGSALDLSNDIRSVTYIAGGDAAASDLATGDDQATFWRNNLGRTYRITEVWCESNSGTPTVNLQRDDGSAANVLTGDLTCTTGGATGTIAAAEQDIAAGDKLDFLLQAVSAGAKRVTVSVKMVGQ